MMFSSGIPWLETTLQNSDVDEEVTKTMEMPHVVCMANVRLMPVVIITSRPSHEQHPDLAAVWEVTYLHKGVGRSRGIVGH